MQEGGSICPFGKVLFSLSKLGLVYSSQLLRKEDTVPTSQGGKVDLHLGKKCDICIRNPLEQRNCTDSNFKSKAIELHKPVC